MDVVLESRHQYYVLCCTKFSHYFLNATRLCLKYALFCFSFAFHLALVFLFGQLFRKQKETDCHLLQVVKTFLGVCQKQRIIYRARIDRILRKQWDCDYDLIVIVFAYVPTK